MKSLLIILIVLFIITAYAYGQIVANTPAPKNETIEATYQRLETDAVYNRQFLPIYAVAVENINDSLSMPAAIMKAARQLSPGASTFYNIGSTTVEVIHHGEYLTFETDICLSGEGNYGRTWFEIHDGPVKTMLTYIREARTQGVLFIKNDGQIWTTIPNIKTIIDDQFASLLIKYNISISSLPLLKEHSDFERERQQIKELLSQTNGILSSSAVETWFAQQEQPIRELADKSAEKDGYIVYKNGKYTLKKQ